VAVPVLALEAQAVEGAEEALEGSEGVGVHSGVVTV
jgi:hypothetical protein